MNTLESLVIRLKTKYGLEGVKITLYCDFSGVIETHNIYGQWEYDYSFASIDDLDTILKLLGA